METSGPGTQGSNRYAYALNNPVSRVDPSGHASIAASVRVSGSGGIDALAYSAVMSGSTTALGAIAVAPVLAFMLLALILVAIVVYYDFVLPCLQEARYQGCAGAIVGFSLATLANGIWGMATDLTETTTEVPQVFIKFIESLPDPPTPDNWDQFKRFAKPVAVGIAILIVATIVGDTSPQPDPQLSPTQTASTVTPTTPPLTPTPTPKPDRCSKLNGGADPILVWGRVESGGTHIILNHGWHTAFGGQNKRRLS